MSEEMKGKDMSEASWMDNTVACSVSIHAWGNSKGVRAAEVSQFSGALAEKVALKRASVTKRLLDCAEYKAITSRDGFAGAWFQAHSVPSLFRRGVYAVPTSYIDQWTGYAAEYAFERVELVHAFVGAYEQARERAYDELGELYRDEDYPLLGDIRRKFWVEIRYLELGVPGKLSLIAPEAFKQAQEELGRIIEQGKGHVEALFCAEVMELVQGLRQALEGLDDAQPKRFYQSHIDKLAEWSRLFLDVRNVTGFDELVTVAEQLENLVMGINPTIVKQFGYIRAEVKTELDGALTTLKGLMQARPGRLIELE